MCNQFTIHLLNKHVPSAYCVPGRQSRRFLGVKNKGPWVLGSSVGSEAGSVKTDKSRWAESTDRISGS